MNTAEKKLIVITGGAGYVGSTLIREVLAANFRVRCLDRLIYGGKSLVGFLNHPDFEIIPGDIRNRFDIARAFEGDVFAVIHLAAIVGDMPCQAAPTSAYQINFQGTQLLADQAKEKKIKRFIFTSTCSNYGITDSAAPADETRKLNPVSLYAETKIDCEEYLMQSASDMFHPTCLRFGTAFGTSFRTRFDLLVNSLVYEAWKNGEIVVFATNMWRPYVHVNDMARIILKILQAELQTVSGQIFNAGATSQNYMKKEVVEMLTEFLPALKVHYANEISDKRNYRVDFTKLESVIDFMPSKSVQAGIHDLILGFQNGLLGEADYESNNVESLKKFFGEREASLSI